MVYPKICSGKENLQKIISTENSLKFENAFKSSKKNALSKGNPIFKIEEGIFHFCEVLLDLRNFSNDARISQNLKNEPKREFLFQNNDSSIHESLITSLFSNRSLVVSASSNPKNVNSNYSKVYRMLKKKRSKNHAKGNLFPLALKMRKSEGKWWLKINQKGVFEYFLSIFKENHERIISNAQE